MSAEAATFVILRTELSTIQCNLLSYLCFVQVIKLNNLELNVTMVTLVQYKRNVNNIN